MIINSNDGDVNLFLKCDIIAHDKREDPKMQHLAKVLARHFTNSYEDLALAILMPAF